MKLLSGIFLWVTLFFAFTVKNEEIVRMDKPSLSGKVEKIIPVYINFKDTLHNDTLKIHYDNRKIPIRYSRNILTGVCIDGKCRLVNIELFWNITGRYLGFKIPKGEFLSKTEHHPFNSEEYDRLHEILSDPISPLANYSLHELVPEKDTTSLEVDAVSSATIAAVLDHIVEGAVYTTYTLWHIVYGASKREIEKITEKKLDSELVLKLLKTGILKDQVWALNHVSNKMNISNELQNELLSLISGNDIYLTERSLNALKASAMNDDVQLELVSVFNRSGVIQKRLIIQKLKEAEKLNHKAALMLSSDLENLNGMLVKTLLELFIIHNQRNKMIVSRVVPLLNNENRYISTQAFKYLNSIENHDKWTQRKIEKYKKKNI